MFHDVRANFTKGEVSPLIHAREDIDLYRAGLARLSNFTILKQGGLRRRAGTRYAGALKTADVKLVDFVFNQEQAYVVEFGVGYARFWTPAGQIYNGAVPYEIATPFTSTDLKRLQWAQVNDFLYLAYRGRPKILKRLGHTNWQIVDAEFEDGPYLPLNDTTNRATITGNPYPATTITISHDTTVSINNGAGFASTDVGRHYRFQWQGKWAWGTIASVLSSTAITVAVVEGGIAAGAEGISWTRKESTTPLDTGIVHYLNAGSASTLTPIDVGKTGKFNIEGTLYWGDIKFVQDSSKVQIVLGNTVGTSSSVTRSWRLGAFSDTTGWPGSVELHDSRVCWGRTDLAPRAVGGSRSNLPGVYAPSDYDGTVTTSHGIYFDLVAGKADEILWMKDGPRLFLGTGSAMRTLGSSSSQEPLGPRNVAAELEIESGTTSVPPVRVGPSTIHVGRFGLSVNEMFYEDSSASLVTPEASILSEHLFRGGVKRLAYQRDPESIVWCVTTTGDLIGMTIERAEKVLGFHDHDIGGAVIDACSVPDTTNKRDAVFLAVSRVVGGVQKYYMETLDAPFSGQIEDAFFVDCGATYSGPAVSTVTGLGHLEGATVDILADGSVQPQQIVTSGQITLPGSRTATKIHVGLHNEAIATTLTAVVPNPEGGSRGLRKRLVYVVVDLLESVGVKVRTVAGFTEFAKLRPPTTPYGAPTPPFTGTAKTNVEDAWDSGAVLSIICDQPLPCTLRAVTLGIEAQP